jgi:hypothetical protein
MDAVGSTGTSGPTPPVTYTFNDDFDGDVYLWVLDDDGGLGVHTAHVTVNNVAPTVSISAYTIVDFTLRVAGEKWHDVTMVIYDEDGVIAGTAYVVRYPGSPDDQSVTVSGVMVDITKGYYATLYYTPADDPVNGQPNGATPAWVIIHNEDCCEVWLHHTFNVKHPGTWIWDLDLSPYMSVAGQTIHFDGYSEDPGSDDATFSWSFGDSGTAGPTTYLNGAGPDPYPSYWYGTYPFLATDSVDHTYAAAGTYTLTLTVVDDDSDSTTVTQTIEIYESEC